MHHDPVQLEPLTQPGLHLVGDQPFHRTAHELEDGESSFGAVEATPITSRLTTLLPTAICDEAAELERLGIEQKSQAARGVSTHRGAWG